MSKLDNFVSVIVALLICAATFWGMDTWGNLP